MLWRKQVSQLMRMALQSYTRQKLVSFFTFILMTLLSELPFHQGTMGRTLYNLHLPPSFPESSSMRRFLNTPSSAAHFTPEAGCFQQLLRCKLPRGSQLHTAFMSCLICAGYHQQECWWATAQLPKPAWAPKTENVEKGRFGSALEDTHFCTPEGHRQGERAALCSGGKETK